MLKKLAFAMIPVAAVGAAVMTTSKSSANAVPLAKVQLDDTGSTNVSSELAGHRYGRYGRSGRRGFRGFRGFRHYRGFRRFRRFRRHFRWYRWYRYYRYYRYYRSHRYWR